MLEDNWYNEMDDAINRRDIAGGQALLDRAEGRFAADNADGTTDARYQALTQRWADMLEGTCRVCGRAFEGHPTAGHTPLPYLVK